MYKLLTIPFKFDARIHCIYGMLIRGILSAVAKILNSLYIRVSAPTPEEWPIKLSNCTPLTFLIHGLSRDQYCTLYEQRIWVFSDISFHVTFKLNPPTCYSPLQSFFPSTLRGYTKWFLLFGARMPLF